MNKTASKSAAPDESLRDQLEEEGESFIPLRHRELVKRLIKWLALSQRNSEQLNQLCQGIVSIFHVEHLASLLQVENLYESLDPDAEAISIEPQDNQKLNDGVEQLFDRISGILHSAHYHQLTQGDLENSVRIGGNWGVRVQVDFQIFSRLVVFARGYRVTKKKCRRWQNLYYEEEIDFPEFHRLVVAFQLRPNTKLDLSMRSDVVYLKMFKNIPESDLEELLPGTTVRLNILDRGKILLPAISGAALGLYKFTRGLMLITFFAVSAFINKMLLLIFLVYYLGRSTLSYFHTKDRYHHGLTRNLYLKNLDNNVGVIYRLFNEAEEQESCESILVYCMLLKSASGMTEPELAKKSVELLEELTGQIVEFDVHDGLGKLAKFGLATVGANETWKAIPLADSLIVLADYWKVQFERGNSLLKLSSIFETVSDQ